jgi:hypothetical protein
MATKALSIHPSDQGVCGRHGAEEHGVTLRDLIGGLAPRPLQAGPARGHPGRRPELWVGLPPGACQHRPREPGVRRSHRRIHNLTNGRQAAIEPYSELVQRIIAAGGILEGLKARIETDRRRRNECRA